MPNDDIQDAHTQWQRTQFDREVATMRWLQRAMPVECAEALRKFVEVNPNQRGIEWWDALSIMHDADAHLDILEPMGDAMEDTWVPTFHAFITYTLIYASKLFSTEYTNAMRVDALYATVANNGGVPEELL
jgi:hypothetical protein